PYTTLFRSQLRRFTRTPCGAHGAGIAQRAGSNLQDARCRADPNMPCNTEPAAFRDRPYAHRCNYVSAVTHWKIWDRNYRGCKDLHLSVRKVLRPFPDPAILRLAQRFLSSGKGQVATFTHVHCGSRPRLPSAEGGCGRLLARLDLDVHVDQRYGGGRDPRDAAGLAQGAGADARQFFVHLARQAAHSGVVKPVGNEALLRALQAFDGFALLVKIAGILDLGLHGLQLVADFRRQAEISFKFRVSSFEYRLCGISAITRV